jgi:hypothetical protein
VLRDFEIASPKTTEREASGDRFARHALTQRIPKILKFQAPQNPAGACLL